MSGSPPLSDWHEGRVPARLPLPARDPAPDGRAGSLRRCWRIRPGRGRTRRDSTEHRQASSCRPTCAVWPYHRTADLRRTSIRTAHRSELGARLQRSFLARIVGFVPRRRVSEHPDQALVGPSHDRASADRRCQRPAILSGLRRRCAALALSAPALAP